MTVGTDDTQPLLRSVTNEGHQVYTDPDPAPALQDGTTNTNLAVGTTIVDFDPNGDAENPLEWPTPFKWAVVSMLAVMAFTVTFTCISVVPLASDIVRDLSPPSTVEPSKSASVLLVTIWELGEAAGPLLIAPLSEMFGRYPVMNAANALFIFATLLAATSATVPQFIVARMLNGLAVASNVLNPAIVGDMFASEERGSALSLIYLAPLIGGAIGPLIGSAVAQALGWRTVVWATVVVASACEVLFLTCFRETYKVTILRRRARKLASGHDGAGLGGKTMFKTAFDEAEGLSGHGEWKKLRDAVLRPAIVWCGSGVLMAMSLFGSVTFAFYYVYSTTFSDILVDVYKLSPVTIGSCFTIFSVGSTLSVFLCNSTLDRVYIRMRDTHNGDGKPEFRLPLAIFGAFALPLSIAAYGWAAELRLPLVFLLFAVCAMGAALMLTMIPVMAYIVDAFGVYSASAMTGVIVTRCLMGTFLPLTTTPLVDKFGYGWGFTAQAGLGLLLAPIPIVMLRYGAYWRKLSKYSRDAKDDTR